MKLLAFIIVLTASAVVNAQTYSLSWSEELKLKKGSTDMEIVASDETGLYFTEAKLGMTKYRLIMPDYGAIYKLIKFDKNYNQIYLKEYRKEMKGLTFHSFQMLGADLYLFAYDWDGKKDTYTLFATKLDKSNGEFLHEFIQIGSFFTGDNKGSLEIRISPAINDSAFLMACLVPNDLKYSVAVTLLDKKLKRLEHAMIQMPFHPSLYRLQDVRLTPEKKILFFGRESESVKKPGDTRNNIVFKQHVLTVFSPKGEKEREIAVSADGRHLINASLTQNTAGEYFLAGFYSNKLDKKEISGFFIHQFDPNATTTLLSSYKEFDTKSLGKSLQMMTDDDLELTKEEKRLLRIARSSGTVYEPPNSLLIRSLEIIPADQSILLTAELSGYAFYRYSYVNSKMQEKTHEIHKYKNQDIVIINATATGELKWVNVIPKSHLETLTSSQTQFQSFINFAYYFSEGNAFPYYSSYTSVMRNNKLHIILNDHKDQLANPKYGNRVNTIQNFRKNSNMYGISVDLNTGAMTRKLIGPNTDEAVLMPRHAYLVGSEMVIPSWRLHSYAKTEFKFARLVID